MTYQAAVAIGPEFGTVGPELIREASKEAVKIADLLVVCGFDPLAAEEASTLGRLTILQARMNPDLATRSAWPMRWIAVWPACSIRVSGGKAAKRAKGA